jgi:hypothetical protein
VTENLIMAHAGKKHVGAGTRGKATGAGALADVPKTKVGENQVLTNRDKKQHSDDRGQDSRAVQNEQLQDNVGNRLSQDSE